MSIVPVVESILMMQNGEYVKQELNEEDHKRQEEFYNKLLTFCRSNICKIVPPTYAIDIVSSEFDKACRTIGRSSVDVILLAKEKGLPLYSDDRYLREHALIEHKLSKFIATPYLLSVMSRENAMSQEEYYKAILKLVLSNYAYIRISTEFLKWLMEENQMKVTPAVEKVFRRTFGMPCDPKAAVSVASKVIKFIWLSGLLHHLKTFFLDFICRLFLNRPDGQQILIDLEPFIRVQFKLYPQSLQEIVPRIRYWRDNYKVY